MNADKVHFKIIFPFKLTIALGTRELERNPTFVLNVKSKEGLVLVRLFTLAAFEGAFLRSCGVGAVFYKL